jgi:hypothetical protein
MYEPQKSASRIFFSIPVVFASGRTFFILLLASLLALTAACTRKESSPGGSESRMQGRDIPANAFDLAPDLTTLPGTVFHVTYTDKVVKMEQATFRKTIRSISSDNNIFVFDASSDEANRLSEGSILFVPGVALRRVVVKAKQDNYVVLGTEIAPLAEAIKDGQIKWDVPVKFDEVWQRQQRAALTAPPNFGPLQSFSDLLNGTVYAAGGINLTGEDGGWKYQISAGPQPGKITLDMNVSKQYSGMIIKVDGSGSVQNFDSSVGLDIQNSVLKDFDFSNKNMNGTMNFNWEAARDEAGVAATEEKIKLPTSFTIPLPVGGIPFSLEVSEALLIHPAFTGAKEIARGKFRVEYNGVQGFDFKEGNMTADGQMTGEGSILDHFSLAPVAPVGFVAAAAMPRFELKSGTDAALDIVKQYVPPSIANAFSNLLSKLPGGDKLAQKAKDKIRTSGAAYAQLIISTDTIAAGAGSLVPCQRVALIVTGTVGVNAYALGKQLVDTSKEIFKQDKTITVPPLKACEL